MEKIVEEQQRFKNLEDQLTETGIQLLTQKAAQEAYTHHSRSRSLDALPLPTYDDLYETPEGQHTERLRQERSQDDDRDR